MCSTSLTSFDPDRNRAWITADGVSLSIDTEYLTPFSHRLQSLYMFIGELHFYGEDVVLKARVASCVDGLDLKLYRQVIEQRRKHEASLEIQSNRSES